MGRDHDHEIKGYTYSELDREFGYSVRESNTNFPWAVVHGGR